MSYPCVHWREAGYRSGHAGNCAIGAHVGPSFGTCDNCRQYDGPPRGLGDKAHSFIQTITLGFAKPCEGCHSRRVAWNAGKPTKEPAPCL